MSIKILPITSNFFIGIEFESQYPIASEISVTIDFDGTTAGPGSTMLDEPIYYTWAGCSKSFTLESGQTQWNKSFSAKEYVNKGSTFSDIAFKLTFSEYSDNKYKYNFPITNGYQTFDLPWGPRN